MQRRSAQPGKYDISLPPTTTRSTTDNTALVCRGAKRKDSGVISNFILLIATLRLLLPDRRGIMMAIDKGRAGILKDSIISPRDLNLNHCPKPGLAPQQWESPTSPDASYTPWAADPPGILPSLSLCCEHGQPRLCMAGALGFPSASQCAQGGRARGSGTPTAAPPLSPLTSWPRLGKHGVRSAPAFR